MDAGLYYLKFNFVDVGVFLLWYFTIILMFVFINLSYLFYFNL